MASEFNLELFQACLRQKRDFGPNLNSETLAKDRDYLKEIGSVSGSLGA